MRSQRNPLIEINALNCFFGPLCSKGIENFLSPSLISQTFIKREKKRMYFPNISYLHMYLSDTSIEIIVKVVLRHLGVRYSHAVFQTFLGSILTCSPMLLNPLPEFGRLPFLSGVLLKISTAFLIGCHLKFCHISATPVPLGPTSFPPTTQRHQVYRCHHLRICFFIYHG